MRFLSILICLLHTALSAVGQTRIHIEGLQTKSESQALELLGGRLEHIKNLPPIPSRADDAAFLLHQLLKNDGYSSVSVAWRISAPDAITLTVREGPRLSLGQINLTGADRADTRRLARLFRNPAEKNRPIGSGQPPFRDDDVPVALGLLVQELHARGHWQATAVETNRRINPTSGAVDMDIAVTPGPLFVIAPATVQSPDGRGVVRVATTTKPFIGRTANTANLNALRLAVEEAFQSRGYPDSKILMARELSGTGFIPQFYIDLGTRVRLNAVVLQGLEKTQPDRVRRLFTPFEGEWYDQAAMNKKVRVLLATGAFSSVILDTNEVALKRIDATLRFDETRAKELSIAAGLGTYEGFITRFTYTDRNLFGQLRALSAGLELSSRGAAGDVRLTDPWLFGTDIAGSARLFALYKQNDGYDNFRTGFEASLTYTGFEKHSFELLAGIAFVETTADGLNTADLGETSYTHTYLRFTHTLDHRDNPVMPKAGWHLATPLELGSAIGSDSTSYFKAGIRGGWFKPLTPDYHLSAGGQFGMLIPSGDGTDLPIDLRYFNGGPRSVRSFEERRLGPLGGGDNPTGGEAYWAASVQLMRRLAGPLHLSTFIDAGSLSRDFDGLTAADLEVAIGLGLRLELPIGPVRLEYGHSLTQDPGQPSGAVHFAIGTAF